MTYFNYEEQAIIKMYSFETKEELITKLNEALEENEDEEMKELVKNLLPKIETSSLEELKNVENVFE